MPGQEARVESHPSPQLTSVNWLTGTSSRMACGPDGTSVIVRCVSSLTLSSILPPLQYHLGASTTATLLSSVAPCRSWQLLEALGEMRDSWPRMVSAEDVFPHPMFPRRIRLSSGGEVPLKSSLIAGKREGVKYAECVSEAKIRHSLLILSNDILPGHFGMNSNPIPLQNVHKHEKNKRTEQDHAKVEKVHSHRPPPESNQFNLESQGDMNTTFKTPQLWDLCGEADERSQSAQQGVQEQRRTARHAHRFLQREEETKHQLLIGGRVGNVVRLWLDRFMFIP
ncbi:hypothetical protein EYF80_006152 [Liparis tanakae]|uniref:Uncharacterized protein n=1 Tax=Liparis tanakae TaxID=230148 RepID=A0A4Z2J1F1_9TELE|nr:hypothetical protein EYF80_006152 [Liparis tanakae]